MNDFFRKIYLFANITRQIIQQIKYMRCIYIVETVYLLDSKPDVNMKYDILELYIKKKKDLVIIY